MIVTVGAADLAAADAVVTGSWKLRPGCIGGIIGSALSRGGSSSSSSSDWEAHPVEAILVDLAEAGISAAGSGGGGRMRQKFEAFIDDLRSTHPNLASVILYGSAAADDLSPNNRITISRRVTKIGPRMSSVSRVYVNGLEWDIRCRFYGFGTPKRRRRFLNFWGTARRCYTVGRTRRS